jgi:hypothetical protein
MKCFQDVGRSSVNVVRGPRPFSPGRIEDWMLANEGRVAAVGDYLNFLRRARAHFEKVARGMGYWNASASHRLGHDRWSVGWAAGSSNLLSIASYSYVLSSYGMTGCILECGVFKGSSTACLSWACNELGLTLYSADSFEGLPSSEGHYAAGDFSGSLDEVMRNVSEFGCIDRVRFISGRYSESLRHFPHEILLLWIDVDLQQSVVDVMQHVAGRLSKSAVIFSDGFAPQMDLDGEHVRNTGGEPAGFYRVFLDRSVTYKAVPGGARGLALIVPRCEEDETVLFSAESFEYLIERL